MNWAQIKALNSTVGTDEFKPLDVIFSEKVDALHGVYIKTSFTEKQFNLLRDAQYVEGSLGINVERNKYYVVEYLVDATLGEDDYEYAHQSLRSDPFLVKGEIYGFYHVRQDILYADEYGVGATLMSFFYNDINTGQLYARFGIANRAGTPLSFPATITVTNVYEVI